MSADTKRICGFILISVPTIQYGGLGILQILSGQMEEPLTDFQMAMFRAGHGHAGVLIIFSLVAQIFVDHAALGKGWQQSVRWGFPLAALMVSFGFFAAANGPGRTSPGQGIWLLYAGAFLLAISLLILGIGLVRSSKLDSSAKQ